MPGRLSLDDSFGWFVCCGVSLVCPRTLDLKEPVNKVNALGACGMKALYRHSEARWYARAVSSKCRKGKLQVVLARATGWRNRAVRIPRD